jgi:serine/threonine protein kinase
MNAPATIAEFLALVRKSGIVDDKRLAAYLAKDRCASPLPREPSKLAERLVHDGLLTHFQAEQFLQGRWRRFTIGNYKVLERIGAGGMGSVFLCEHKFMRRRAAVKVLPTSQAHDPSALQRFYREARAVAALDHPNIVRAYDVDQEDHLHFLVMEYVDGSSLQDIVQRVGPLDPIRAAHYISQAALGLQHSHEVAGLVHRDIKPGNIIVDRTGMVKVLDLGLARFFYDDEDALTKQIDDNVLGTADYLAPEQALDSHSVDIRGDIYSLGGTFYYCLTRQAPFAEGTVAQKLIWHQSRQPKPIRAFRSDVPDGIIAIINKMMVKDPEQRYQTPIEVCQALASWTQKSIAPPAEVEMPRLSRAARRGAGEMSPSSRTHKVWQVPSGATPALHGSTPAHSPPPAKPAAVAPAGPRAVKARETEGRGTPPSDAPPVLAQQDKAAPSPVLPDKLELGVSDQLELELAGDDHVSFAELPRAPRSREEESEPAPALAAETENYAAKADTDPHTPKKAVARRRNAGRPSARARRKQRQQSEQRQYLYWWGGSVGGGCVVLLGVLVLALSSGKRHKVEDAPATAPPPLLVSHSGQENAFRSVGDAIRKAKDKDHILVLDNVEEQLELTDSKKDLVIETPPGKAIVWRFPRTIASGKELLWLNGVGHLRIKGFTLDGRNLVDQVVRITGHCPGLTLEDVQLRGFRYFGILLANCAGRSDEPVSLVRLQAPTTDKKEAALAFVASPTVSSPRINQHIIVNDCRFDGPYKTPVLLVGDTSVIKDVVFSDQRKPTVLIQTPK